MTLVGQLLVSSGGAYDMMNEFSGNANFPAGTVFTVHVIAQFDNGESIDQCQTITLVAPSGNVDQICALIRGSINDYSSSHVSYQVDIWH